MKASVVNLIWLSGKMVMAQVDWRYPVLRMVPLQKPLVTFSLSTQTLLIAFLATKRLHQIF